MGERRFVIAKMPEFCVDSELYNITETELIRRCNAIRKPEFITEDRTIDILLNGELEPIILSSQEGIVWGDGPSGKEDDIILSRAEPVSVDKPTRIEDEDICGLCGKPGVEPPAK